MKKAGTHYTTVYIERILVAAPNPIWGAVLKPGAINNIPTSHHQNITTLSHTVR
jgi:hypothetical protein